MCTAAFKEWAVIIKPYNVTVSTMHVHTFRG